MMSIPSKVFVSVFVLAILCACTPAEVPSQQQLVDDLEIVVEQTLTAQETRYINSEGSFSLVLPESWQVAGPQQGTSGGGLSFSLYRLGQDPDASGGPGTSSIVIADAGTLTIEAFVLGQCSTCPLAPIEDIVLGEVAARQTVIGGGGVPVQVTWTFFEHAGKLIGLAIHNSETLEPLTGVLQSLELH